MLRSTLATAANILHIVGAAKDGRDASWRSPASAQTAFTIGAVDWTHSRASFSSWGSDVDLFAPGV